MIIRFRSRVVLLLVGTFLLSACSRMPSLQNFNPLEMVSGPAVLRVELPEPRGALPLLRNGQPLRLVVGEVVDGRAGAPGRKLGNIKATVVNIHSGEIALDQDIAAFLGQALRARLGADGFRVAAANAPADFRLTTELKAFSLEVASRDERRIVATLTMHEAGSGEVIWSGQVTEQADRYAGVNGNSRGTLIEYLSEGVVAFLDKSSTAVRDGLMRTYPRSITLAQTKIASSTPGVVLLHEPASREPAPSSAANAPIAPAVQSTPTPMPIAPRPVVAPDTRIATTTGYVSLYSQPTRAKVYIDEVYHGVTPLRLELPVGVANLSFRLEGYKPEAERVAVRPGQTTELEVRLGK